MKIEWTPDRLIDRVAEREMFHAMLSFAEGHDARLLTIMDKGGHGKSALLRRLEYDVKFALDTERYVALISLDQLSDPTAFGLIEFARYKLGSNAPFTNFDNVMRARARRVDEAFGSGGLIQGGITGTLNAQSAQMTGESNTYAGVSAPIARADNVTINGAPQWSSPDQEKQARNACVEAFLSDLKVICATTPVVLILDAWERCNAALQDWIHTDFLKTQCFDLQKRPQKLALVIAGRQVPPFPVGLGYERLVDSILKFSDWEVEHVRQFLEVHGYTDVMNEEVEFICSRLKHGWSLEKALRMIAEFENAS